MGAQGGRKLQKISKGKAKAKRMPSRKTDVGMLLLCLACGSVAEVFPLTASATKCKLMNPSFLHFLCIAVGHGFGVESSSQTIGHESPTCHSQR
eukprot:3988342-Amphidinium_carterae.1